MGYKMVFYSDKAPKPRGPYSQAVVHDKLLYVSGQIPVEPQTETVISGTIEIQTERALNNIKAIVEGAGAGMEDVLKVTCYLTEPGDSQGFNNVYKKFFQSGPPARSTVFVKGLPLNVKVEIDAIVAVKEVECGK